jgi:hypothetical protein
MKSELRGVCIGVLAASALLTQGCLTRPPGPGPKASLESSAAADPITGGKGAPAEPRHEHVKVVEKSDREEHEVALPAAAQARLERCHERGGGKLRVRVKGAGAKRVLEAEPGSSLHPTERRCVLDSLSALRDDEIGGSLGSGAVVPATGFSSLLTVEW